MKLFTKTPPMYGLQVNHSGQWIDLHWFCPANIERVQATAKAVAKAHGTGLHTPVLRVVLDDKSQRVLHHWCERDGWRAA